MGRNDVVVELTRRALLSPDDPAHISEDTIAAVLEGRLMRPVDAATLGGEGIMIAIESMIDRLVERGYHRAMSKSFGPAGTFRMRFPPFVRMPTECQGRLDRMSLVGAQIRINQLVTLLNADVKIDLDRCTDVVERPCDSSNGMRVEWYAAFGQFGYLYPRALLADAERRFWPDREIGLTLHEALHVALQHPLAVHECGIICAGSRHTTEKGELRVPVVRFEDRQERFLVGSYPLDAAYRGAAVGSRSTTIVSL